MAKLLLLYGQLFIRRRRLIFYYSMGESHKMKKYYILLFFMLFFLVGFSQREPIYIEESVEIILTKHDTVLYRVKIRDKFENYMLASLRCEPMLLDASLLANRWGVVPFNDNNMFCFEIEISKLKGFTLHPVIIELYNTTAYNHLEYYLTE